MGARVQADGLVLAEEAAMRHRFGAHGADDRFQRALPREVRSVFAHDAAPGAGLEALGPLRRGLGVVVALAASSEATAPPPVGADADHQQEAHSLPCEPGGPGSREAVDAAEGGTAAEVLFRIAPSIDSNSE